LYERTRTKHEKKIAKMNVDSQLLMEIEWRKEKKRERKEQI
jgi:hypothetical protein